LTTDAKKKTTTKVGRPASHGAAFLHFTQESMSHTSISVFTDEMPKTCKPTTSKTVSNFRNCPGTMAPTRALKDETVAGQPIQSFTGISVNMRQLSLSAISACLQQSLLSIGCKKQATNVCEVSYSQDTSHLAHRPRKLLPA